VLAVLTGADWSAKKFGSMLPLLPRKRRDGSPMYLPHRPSLAHDRAMLVGDPIAFVRNQDKPGFIGNLGRTLSEAGINIATFHLGRKAAGEDAICLVQVDQALDDAVLAHVCALPNVMQVRQLRF
jgi:hypothetical protein